MGCGCGAKGRNIDKNQSALQKQMQEEARRKMKIISLKQIECNKCEFSTKITYKNGIEAISGKSVCLKCNKLIMPMILDGESKCPENKWKES